MHWCHVFQNFFSIINYWFLPLKASTECTTVPIFFFSLVLLLSTCVADLAYCLQPALLTCHHWVSTLIFLFFASPSPHILKLEPLQVWIFVSFPFIEWNKKTRWFFYSLVWESLASQINLAPVKWNFCPGTLLIWRIFATTTISWT